MEIDELKSAYNDIVKTYSSKNHLGRNVFRAFWVGGVFCVIGELMGDFYMWLELSETLSKTLATVSLILLSTILTAINIYDKIGNYAGAGSIIPITGFANSMVSAAMEYKKEGYVYGMGSKLFTVAGPVIVFGTISSVVIGILYYFIRW